MTLRDTLREGIDALRQDGRQLAYVILPPTVWELVKHEYITDTGRMGPLEVNGREVLGLPVRTDPDVDEVTVVAEDVGADYD